MLTCANAEGTTNQQCGRRPILIVKGADPWADPWNVIFIPTELVIVMSLLLVIVMSLLLESVELPLAPESDAVSALGLAAGAPLSVDFFDELPPDESA